MSLYKYKNFSPKIDESALVFPNATLIGDVSIGKNAGIWPGVTIRGDKERIVIKDGSNIQEHCVLHADPGFPLTVHENATIGHNVVLHGCTIGSHTVVGIGSIILNGVIVGDNCLITAGSILSLGPTYPANSLISGSPAKVIMKMSESDVQNLKDTAIEYMELAKEYKDQKTFSQL